MIDLNLSTQCKTEQGQDGKAWLEIRFGEVQCVERVVWLGETAEHRFVWTCSDTGCDTCGGIEVDRCGEFRVTVSMETTSTNAPSLDSTRCKSGDSVRLERVDYTRYRGIWPAEIAVLETQGKWWNSLGKFSFVCLSSPICLFSLPFYNMVTHTINLIDLFGTLSENSGILREIA